MKPLVLLTLMAGTLYADGGMLLLHREAGPYSVSVFASPAPPRAGIVDLSILVQTSETSEAVLDAGVELTLSHAGERKEIRLTRGQSQNKLLYSAPVELPAGEWIYTATIGGSHGAATVSGLLTVGGGRPGMIEYWPELLAPFVFIGLFAVHQISGGRVRGQS